MKKIVRASGNKSPYDKLIGTFLIFIKKYDIIYIESEGNKNMDTYFIHRALRNFKDNHRYLYTAFVVFLTMVGIIVGAALAFTPIILTAFYTPLWLLSTFIIYPLGIAFFSWVFDCFDF